MASFLEREQKRNDLLCLISEVSRKNPDGEINLTIAEAATYLYCSRQTVRRLIWDRRINATRPGKEVMVSLETLKNHLEATSKSAIAGCRDQKR
jgi:excisionase family DNA binding protein